MSKDKWYRICRSGPTVDGRTVSPEMLNQVAASYDPVRYGARINIEHHLSLTPDGIFPAVGDVLAVKAETDPDGARVLLAQIAPTERLVQLSRARQKVFFSAEIEPNFAKTGTAYLMGLAVTDMPASLGTEMLRLSLGDPAARAALPEGRREHLFSVAVESEAPLGDQEGAGLLDRVRDLLSGNSKDGAKTAARLSSLEQATTEMAAALGDVVTLLSNATPTTTNTDTGSPSTAASPPMQPTAPAAGATSLSSPSSPAASASPPDVTAQIAALSTQVSALTEALSATANGPGRPLAAGGTSSASLITDC